MWERPRQHTRVSWDHVCVLQPFWSFNLLPFAIVSRETRTQSLVQWLVHYFVVFWDQLFFFFLESQEGFGRKKEEKKRLLASTPWPGRICWGPNKWLLLEWLDGRIRNRHWPTWCSTKMFFFVFFLPAMQNHTQLGWWRNDDCLVDDYWFLDVVFFFVMRCCAWFVPVWFQQRYTRGPGLMNRLARTTRRPQKIFFLWLLIKFFGFFSSRNSFLRSASSGMFIFFLFWRNSARHPNLVMELFGECPVTRIDIPRRKKKSFFFRQWRSSSMVYYKVY